MQKISPAPPTLLAPRSGPLPTLRGHCPHECARLDERAATSGLLGQLFTTGAVSDQGLLREMNRGRTQWRALSLLDVLCVLEAAGGGAPDQPARLRGLLNLPHPHGCAGHQAG